MTCIKSLEYNYVRSTAIWKMGVMVAAVQVSWDRAEVSHHLKTLLALRVQYPHMIRLTEHEYLSIDACYIIYIGSIDKCRKIFRLRPVTTSITSNVVIEFQVVVCIDHIHCCIVSPCDLVGMQSL